MKNNNKSKKNKRIIIVVTSVLIIAAILFGLAYRYLIQRVEANVVDSSEINMLSDTTDTATYDDRSYKSENIEINIDKVTTGSGSNSITYFVADVKVADATYLKSAFAQNKFGRNIVESTSDIAEDNNAIFAINGDYYGFREDGILIRNGVVYRDSGAREGLALYSNGSMESYDETRVTGEELLAKGVVNTLSFGPVLVDDGEATTDFQKVSIDSNFGNRTIENSNPRTGIGIIEPNHYVFIVVDGRSQSYSKGMTLNEFAVTFKELGCTEAYNLDGGGSSTMYFMGKVVNNPLGKGEERDISDIIYIN